LLASDTLTVSEAPVQSSKDIMGYDYMIVGGGSAGCTLAAPPSEDPQIKVLLREAGGSDWNPLFHWPTGIAKMIKGFAGWVAGKTADLIRGRSSAAMSG